MVKKIIDLSEPFAEHDIKSAFAYGYVITEKGLTYLEMTFYEEGDNNV